jgi:6-phosphofructokinase 1
MNVTVLGEARFPSPIRRTVSDALRVPEQIVSDPESPPAAGLRFELAGPRAKLFFDAKQARAGIVTCGGLCPGLNDVIRSLFLELHHAYGVKEVLGFRGGYGGLDPSRGPNRSRCRPSSWTTSTRKAARCWAPHGVRWTSPLPCTTSFAAA